MAAVAEPVPMPAAPHWGPHTTPLLDEEGSNSCDDLRIKFTIFADVRANKLCAKEETWGDLTETLSDLPRTAAKKEDCPLLKLATFGEQKTSSGFLRHDANLQDIYGVEGDHDAGTMTVAEAAQRLQGAGIEAMLYTTASHTAERPRWRVLSPLSRPHTKADRTALVKHLDAALAGAVARESYVASQTYYFGRVEGVPYETQRVHGAPLDEAVHANPARAVSPAMGTTTARTPRPALQVVGVAQGDDDQGAALSELDRQRDRRLLLSKVAEQTFADLRGALDAIPADDRNTWVKAGQALAWFKGTEHESAARELWVEWSSSSGKFDPDSDPEKWGGFTADRIDYRAVFTMAKEHGWTQPTVGGEAVEREDRSDAGNANVLLRITDGNLRFITERRHWLHWNGGRWVVDASGGLTQKLALSVAEHYLALAEGLREQARSPSCSEEDRRRLERVAKSHDGWALQCRNKGRLDAMLALASRDVRAAVAVAELDRDPCLLGVQNGVVDLRTGSLRASSRDELVTKHCAVKFAPAASAPRWARFIEEITATPMPVERDASGAPLADSIGRYRSRPELAAYLQRALGYSVTGKTTEQVMAMAIGAGSNGKNVLLDTVQALLGEYAATIPAEALMATRHDSDAERPSPVLASLAGARMAICSESKDGHSLDVALWSSATREAAT